MGNEQLRQVLADWRVRFGLLTRMLTTGGYGALGATLAPGILREKNFDAISWFTLLLGIVALGLALYYAPYGDGSNDA